MHDGWVKKRVLVTGARGTIGAPMCERLRAIGANVMAWDREVASPLDEGAIDRYVRAQRPDRIVHLAVASRPTGADDEGPRIDYAWPVRLATAAHAIGADLLFTSTAMVFSNDARGPFTIASIPDAAGGYGHHKRRAETAVAAAHPPAVIVRLGWQIADAPGGNQMHEHLRRRAAEDGRIVASTRWLPACSWLPDTIEALLGLADRPGGVYMIDGNDGWSFHAIATAIRDAQGADWAIESSADFVYDQRLIDPRVNVRSIADRLPGLRSITPSPRPD